MPGGTGSRALPPRRVAVANWRHPLLAPRPPSLCLSVFDCSFTLCSTPVASLLLFGGVARRLHFVALAHVALEQVEAGCIPEVNLCVQGRGRGKQAAGGAVGSEGAEGRAAAKVRRAPPWRWRTEAAAAPSLPCRHVCLPQAPARSMQCSRPSPSHPAPATQPLPPDSQPLSAPPPSLPLARAHLLAVRRHNVAAAGGDLYAGHRAAAALQRARHAAAAYVPHAVRGQGRGRGARRVHGFVRFTAQRQHTCVLGMQGGSSCVLGRQQLPRRHCRLPLLLLLPLPLPLSLSLSLPLPGSVPAPAAQDEPHSSNSLYVWFVEVRDEQQVVVSDPMRHADVVGGRAKLCRRGSTTRRGPVGDNARKERWRRRRAAPGEAAASAPRVRGSCCAHCWQALRRRFCGKAPDSSARLRQMRRTCKHTHTPRIAHTCGRRLGPLQVVDAQQLLRAAGDQPPRAVAAGKRHAAHDVLVLQEGRGRGGGR